MNAWLAVCLWVAAGPSWWTAEPGSLEAAGAATEPEPALLDPEVEQRGGPGEVPADPDDEAYLRSLEESGGTALSAPPPGPPAEGPPPPPEDQAWRSGVARWGEAQAATPGGEGSRLNAFLVQGTGQPVGVPTELIDGVRIMLRVTAPVAAVAFLGGAALVLGANYVFALQRAHLVPERRRSTADAAAGFFVVGGELLLMTAGVFAALTAGGIAVAWLGDVINRRAVQ
ncbi:MAG: hypothetical protein HY904_24640 [Deltaproteobacteria bacterium]|nr:hypothetical protein [Deltaproteobacteria bacterium]